MTNKINLEEEFKKLKNMMTNIENIRISSFKKHFYRIMVYHIINDVRCSEETFMNMIDITHMLPDHMTVKAGQVSALIMQTMSIIKSTGVNPNPIDIVQDTPQSFEEALDELLAVDLEGDDDDEI